MKIQFPPVQRAFDEADLRNFKVTRHQLRTSWPDVIQPAVSPGKDLRLRLPFEETYWNAFQSMLRVPTTGLFGKGPVTTYLQGTGDQTEAPEAVQRWVEAVGKYVAMRDFLALSFALDYDRDCGNPAQPQTDVGLLRSQAKPYGNQNVTSETTAAADVLAERCLHFLGEMTCYRSATCVVAMPPSDPAKEYNLPRYLAQQIALKSERADLSQHARTTKVRGSLKAIEVQNKLDTLLGTIQIDPGVFDKKIVLLLDDLYQSGISMNYCALMLLRAGSSKVFGLACEKTCRNDDNISGRI